METNKKYFNRLAGGAMLLAGAMAFAACSSDEDFADAVNPGAGATGETVKTQFSIAVPGAASANKRLGSDIVQANGVTFRGMRNIRLAPFANVTTSGQDAGLSASTPTSLEPIALGAIGISELKGSGSYKVYNDVDIPVGVNYFLFYGEASEETPGSEINGSLIPSYEVDGWPLNQNLSELSFGLEDILGTGNVTESQTALATILTNIAKVTGTENDNTAWSAATSGSALKQYYDNFVSLKAGSANSIKAALQDLYNAMKSDRVANEDKLKEAITAEIDKSFDADETPTGSGVYTLEWKDAIAENVKTFPENLGLPDGSQQLTCTGGTFSYVTPSTSGQNDNILQQTGYKKYVYPASLFYTVATPIKTADQIMTNNNGIYNGTFTDWEGVLNLPSWNGDAKVDGATQSIALVNPIQYAVASLHLFVRFADDYIYDNGASWPAGASIGEIAVPVPEEGFSLTGILVGGQNPVAWDFIPAKAVNDQDVFTIYDASTDGAKVKKAAAFDATPTAYTLALETKGVAEGSTVGTDMETVRFALEMINESGAEFIGADGIVPAGGKFYLVGSLESNKNTGDPLKVFEQDHKTIARVTINSLKSAYNCIPDLRSPKLELGLAVNLEWQKGLEANVTID